MRMRRFHVTAAVAAATLLLTACGATGEPASPQGDGAQDPSSAHAAGEAGMQHVHGLGVRRGTLYIATHSGLWVAADGQTKARRFGRSQQDIMGFAVVGENRFLGSGHPHPSERDAPPNLGLIESRDGGRTWQNISLHGQADFHVLESSGPRIYGFDGTRGRLMVSSDRGRSWRQRTAPAAIFSLAIDPADRDSVVISTERGLFASDDAGERWRAFDLRGRDVAGLLAWPRAAQLLLVDGQGQVQQSSDGGARWDPVGDIGGVPAAFIAAGGDLYAALGDGSVKRSADGGRSWTVRAAP